MVPYWGALADMDEDNIKFGNENLVASDSSNWFQSKLSDYIIIVYGFDQNSDLSL